MKRDTPDECARPEADDAMRRIEEKIAEARRRDLEEWFKLHSYDIGGWNGSSSEFKV
jgi:hypothetical protein